MIAVSSLAKSYGNHRLFDGLSFTLDEGIYCLSGPSGCGKTTLGRILTGVEDPDAGTVTGLVGAPVVLFQEPRLLPSLSAKDNVACVSGQKNVVVRAIDLLRQLGFTDEDVQKKPSELSGGMQQRVAIARAILFACENPSNFTLLDEPFRGLDPEMKKVAADLLRKSFAGRTVLVITHDEDDAQLLDGRTISFEALKNGIC